MALITCRDVRMEYNGQLAVDQLNLELQQGDYLCIVGQNGSGKSTFIKGLLGLQKPAVGTITFNSIRQTEIGYLPQQTPVQKDFPASVYEVVLSGCLNQKGMFSFYSQEDRQRAKESMELLGIADLKKKSYRDLSGGQQQRVLLARALGATKKLLLLDEPVAGLDPIVTSGLYAVIKQLNETKNITVIMVSHDIVSAVKYGTKILHMETTPLFFGSTEEYKQTDMYRLMTGGAFHA